MTGAFVGKRALVTGAASGIGLATARALAAAGADVLLTDVDDAAGQAAADELGAAFAHLDVSRADAWTALLAQQERLDLLHLNAGIYDIDLGDITAIGDARYRAYLGVNVDGVFYGLRTAVPLLERSRGAVVVTGSMAGIGPLATNPLYALSKFAVTGFVRSVHADMLARGIRLNMLSPGAVATAIMGTDARAWYDERGVAASEPEEIAATIVELFGSDRSGEIVLHMAPHPPRALAFPGLSDL